MSWTKRFHSDRLAHWDAVRMTRAGVALLVTAIAYGASQLRSLHLKLGWDETIYLSQVSRRVPAAFFSAPRARGITWLAEPLALVSSPSVPQLRLYLTVLSAVALFVTFRIWFTVLAPGAVVIAAVAFGSLWVTGFYGAQLMPNLWVAFGVLAAVGGYLRLSQDPGDRIGLAALPIGLAEAALMRPTDAAYAALPLLVLTVVVPAWRRIGRIYVLIMVGSILGALPWVIEAFTRFGGIGGRLQQASAIQGGLGWHPDVLLQHWQTLDGPLLCRPCTPDSSPPLDTYWLLLLPLLVIAAALIQRNLLVPGLVGLALATPYLLLVSYSAPRFLLPAFVLLALPFAATVWWLLTGPLTARVPWSRYALGAVVVVLLGAQIIGQQRIMDDRVSGSVVSTKNFTTIADELHHLGVQAPCVLSGFRSPQLAFYAGCGSRNVGGHDGSISSEGLIALAEQTQVVAIVPPGGEPPFWARRWERHDLPTASDRTRPWVAYIAPRPTA